ncbi:hypothetical protein LMG33818_000241 [Halomonadaceae bacterium LMG 33818]|uniref:hypothetical protein n=1 Tax=Cernens ardua TaxID=3402176 RepID=UPI003EDC65B4
MSDPFNTRGEHIKASLLQQESQGHEDDLFALGYMIPQIEIVLDHAEYDPHNVHAEDFDETYREWLQHSFAQDSMSVDDREQVIRLLDEAIAQAEKGEA